MYRLPAAGFDLLTNLSHLSEMVVIGYILLSWFSANYYQKFILP
tara:strand:+ start:109 stop:240 length:132 start_codon:yes stop_codon:yes gene_type:complete